MNKPLAGRVAAYLGAVLVGVLLAVALLAAGLAVAAALLARACANASRRQFPYMGVGFTCACAWGLGILATEGWSARNSALVLFIGTFLVSLLVPGWVERAERPRRSRQRGDELQRLATQVGLRDPWSDPRAAESHAELAKIGHPERRAGRTTRMLLMALLSIERGRSVVIVGSSTEHAHLLFTLFRGLAAKRFGARVPAVLCRSRYFSYRDPRLAQIMQGQPGYDLYIDHFVWEMPGGERLSVAFGQDGEPVISLMPPGSRPVAGDVLTFEGDDLQKYVVA